MRSTLPFGTKLMAGAVSMFVLMVLLGYFGLSTASTLKEQFGAVMERDSRETGPIAAIELAQSEMAAAERGIILAAFARDAVEGEGYKLAVREQLRAMRSAVEELRPIMEKQESLSVTADIGASLSAWEPHYEEIVRQCAAGNPAEANRIRKDLTIPILRRIASDGRQLADTQAQIVWLRKKMLAGDQDWNRWIAISMLLGLGLLVGGMGVAFVRKISRSLQGAVAGLSEGTARVAAAASQVSSGGQSLAQGASHQAASLEETSASAEEVTSMTHKNAENSQTAAQFMAEASRFVAEANHNLEEMVVSMREINASSDKISKIIKVIDEIAFQTNILALNAAVEAARAGEAGMGFAVVADEVRNLSQRCAQAAKDTAVLIEESIVKSNEGKVKLDKVAGVIRSVTESSEKVKTLVDEVSLGSQEQARGIEQISKAIGEMEKVTHKNAANARQSASAGAELGAQSETMQGIVEQLAALVGRATASSSRECRPGKPSRAATKGSRTSAPAVAAPSKQAAAQKSTMGANRLATSAAAVDKYKRALPMDGDFSDF